MKLLPSGAREVYVYPDGKVKLLPYRAAMTDLVRRLNELR